jgi:transposase
MNQLKVNQQQSILLLRQQGWSKRRIARELALDRGTVRKYLAEAAPKPATNPHTGSTARPGPASACEPWRAQIERALAQGLSVQRIYQDLVTEQQFAGGYHAVRRFVVRLVGKAELPFRRRNARRGRSCRWILAGAPGWWRTESVAARICFGRC